MIEPTRFSFVVSNYNYERYLPECLDSLFGQTYDPRYFEVVCVNDGSTDRSWEIIESYKKRYPNMNAISIANSGLEKACNTGIRAARYDRIVRVDADDVVGKDVLRLMDEAIRTQPEHDFYYCKNFVEYYGPDEQTAKTLPPFDAAEIWERGDFFATATVYKKSDLEEIGLFPEDVKNCGLENYSVILSFLHRGKKGFAVAGATFNYRRHRVNMSIVKRQAIIDYGRAMLKRYGREFRTNQYHPYNLKLDDVVSR